ncbi:MAG: hypothetical protein WCO50_02460, partial [Synechococcus sp. ELA619]
MPLNPRGSQPSPVSAPSQSANRPAAATLTAPTNVGVPAGTPSRSWWEGLQRWWAEFSLQTKLLAVATLVVSLMMTGLTFFALNGIQTDVRMSDTRYARDLGLLLS